MRVLSFDPGETTGWAYQKPTDDYPGGLLNLGQEKGLQALVDMLESFNPSIVDHVVIESYEVWGSTKGMKANKGSKLETVQAIGVIKSWCMRNHIPFSMSDAKNNAINAKHTGLNPEAHAHKNTHWAYAANHGRKFLIDKKLAKTALVLQMERSRNG